MSVDYLCIGAPRAGTTWFALNFNAHPDVISLPIKELRFFSDNPWTPDNKSRRITQLSAGKYFKDWYSDWFSKWQDSGTSIEDYQRLFNDIPVGIVGDNSPSYCACSPAQVRMAFEAVGDVPVFLFLRDPVERDCSHIRFESRNWRGSIADNINKIRTLISSKSMRNRSNYVRAIDNWSKYFDLTIFFFEEIQQEPTGVLSRAWRAVDADTSKNPEKTRNLTRHVNATPESSIPVPIVDELRQLNKDTIIETAARLGSYAEQWKEKHF